MVMTKRQNYELKLSKRIVAQASGASHIHFSVSRYEDATSYTMMV
jgi:hypothetical protein